MEAAAAAAVAAKEEGEEEVEDGGRAISLASTKMVLVPAPGVEVAVGGWTQLTQLRREPGVAAYVAVVAAVVVVGGGSSGRASTNPKEKGEAARKRIMILMRMRKRMRNSGAAFRHQRAVAMPLLPWILPAAVAVPAAAMPAAAMPAAAASIRLLRGGGGWSGAPGGRLVGPG